MQNAGALAFGQDGKAGAASRRFGTDQSNAEPA